MEGDGEAQAAYCCLHLFHILPSQYLAMSAEEKAFLIAAIAVKNEQKGGDPA